MSVCFEEDVYPFYCVKPSMDPFLSIADEEDDFDEPWFGDDDWDDEELEELLACYNL